MYFQYFWTWLSGRLANYIGDNVWRLERAIEPAVVTCATLFVMLWGYMAFTGKLQEHVVESLKRVVLLFVVLGAGLQLWLYNTVIVDTFFNAPTQLAAAVVGSRSPVAVVDTIWARGGAVASELWNRGGVFRGDVGNYVAAVFVYAAVGTVAVYTMFLLCLSKVALSIILVLGPLFICFLLFDATKRFFESWVAMLSNYALITILTSLASALLLGLVEGHAVQTALLGSSVATVDTLSLIIASCLVVLILRQIPSISSGLASGVALSTFGVVGRVVGWALNKPLRFGSDFGKGVMDGARGMSVGRYQSMGRTAGTVVARGIVAAGSKLVARRGGTASSRK